jgi:hypothetical protein
LIYQPRFGLPHAELDKALDMSLRYERAHTRPS